MPGRSESMVHASVVATGGRGLLILGPSGSGKSTLALALVGRGAGLVADDQVCVVRRGGALIASAPASLAGMIEARGIGLLRIPFVAEVPVVLAVDMNVAPAARMPQRRTITYLGVEVELISGRGLPNLELALMILMQNGHAFPEQG